MVDAPGAQEGRHRPEAGPTVPGDVAAVGVTPWAALPSVDVDRGPQPRGKVRLAGVEQPSGGRSLRTGRQALVTVVPSAGSLS